MDTDPIDYQVPEELKGGWRCRWLWQHSVQHTGLGHFVGVPYTTKHRASLIPERIFQGNLIDGYWNAPDITGNELYVDGWDEKTPTILTYSNTRQRDRFCRDG